MKRIITINSNQVHKSIETRDLLKEKLIKIDSSILKYEGFWIEELEQLIEEIEER